MTNAIYTQRHRDPLPGPLPRERENIIEAATRIHPIFAQKTHAQTPYLTIGKVAAITGASAKAIRHYEALGLMPQPRRRGKYRVYSEHDVFLVHVLKHGQTLGFRLSEMRGLVSEKVARRRFPLELANALFDRKRAELEAQIAALREVLARLAANRREMNRLFRA
jgi:MerR family copper efflux transcriptional regulator